MKSSSIPTKEQLTHYLQKVRSYAPIGLIVFLLAIYGFLGLHVMNLLAAEPDQTEITMGLQTMGIPKVDEEVVTKMQRLEDNSVNVQTLFDEARSNPFQE